MGDYLGIDLHKSKSFVTRMTAQGQIVEQVNLHHTRGPCSTTWPPCLRTSTWRSKRPGTGCGCTNRSKSDISIWCWPIP